VTHGLHMLALLLVVVALAAILRLV